MPRTPEQKDADAGLTAAIDAVTRVDYGPDPGILVDYVVVAQYTRFGDDGEEQEGYFLQFPNGTMPDHRALGLLNYGRHFLLFGRHDDKEEEEG